jgi:hypothetical protein
VEVRKDLVIKAKTCLNSYAPDLLKLQLLTDSRLSSWTEETSKIILKVS